MVRIHSVSCFLLWPARELWNHLVHGVCRPQPWPTIFCLPVAGLLLHSSVEQHLAHVLWQTCTIFWAPGLTNTARLTSIVLTTLTTFMMVAKLKYFKASAQAQQSKTVLENVRELSVICFVLCFSASLLLIALSERFPEEFWLAVREDSSLWIAAAMALLLLGLLCMVRPHIITDCLAKLGVCTDLEAVTLDQHYPEQMAAGVRLILLMMDPLILARLLIVNASYPGAVANNVVLHLVFYVYLLYWRPSHKIMVDGSSLVICILIPLALLYHHFSLSMEFASVSRWPPIFETAAISTVLHSSLERHLGPLCCLSAVIFVVSHDMLVRLTTVALVILSSVLLVLKISFLKSSITSQQNACLKAQYRAMNKLRDTMDHQVHQRLPQYLSYIHPCAV